MDKSQPEKLIKTLEAKQLLQDAKKMDLHWNLYAIYMTLLGMILKSKDNLSGVRFET